MTKTYDSIVQYIEEMGDELTPQEQQVLLSYALWYDKKNKPEKNKLDNPTPLNRGNGSLSKSKTL